MPDIPANSGRNKVTLYSILYMDNEYTAVLQPLKNFFNSGATRGYAFRKNQLLALRDMLLENEEAIYQALYKDLGKGKEEAYGSELGLVLAEIRYALARLKGWMRPKTVS